jgi:hypothetical protein
MIDINIFVNQGVEAFGTTGRTLTVNELPKEVSLDFVAEELHHKMRHLEKEDITMVMERFLDVAARMMAEGFCIQYTNTKEAVMMRLYTDARLDLPTKSINLAKARELMPDVVTDEQSMVDHAGELVSMVGVRLRPYVEVQKKFHELLADYKPKYQVKGIVERDYVERKDGDEPGDGGNGNGGSDGGDNGGDENLEG